MTTIPNPHRVPPASDTKPESEDAPKVESDGVDRVKVDDLEVESKDLVELLETRDVSEYASTLREVIVVGAAVLLRAQATRDLDLVQRKIDATMMEVETRIAKLPQQVEERLAEEIGREDSEVLAPFKDTVKDATTQLTQQTAAVKDLFTKEIDPSKDSTTLGKALKGIKDQLDPKRTDSIQARVDKMLEDVSKKDGRIAEVVKTTVAEQLKPLQDIVADLAKEVRKNEAVEEIIESTTLKGAPFEEAVVATLRPWAATADAGLEAVGADNHPGDIVVDLTSGLTPRDIRIVVEAKNRGTKFGRKRISDVMDAAMDERDAHAGVYVAKSTDGLAAEIGDWTAGSVNGKPWVATTIDNVAIAVRYVTALVELEALRAARPDVDAGAIASIATQIETALKDLGSVKRIARDGATQIETYVDTVRDRITQGVRDLEREITRAQKPSGAQAAA